MLTVYGEFNFVAGNNARFLECIALAREQRKNKPPAIRNVNPKERAGTAAPGLTGGDQIVIDEQAVVFHFQLDGIQSEIARPRPGAVVPQP